MTVNAFYPPKGLTIQRQRPHNGPTTTIDGNTAPRKTCGFFASGFCHQGPLTRMTGTGTRQFFQIGAYWATWRTKPGNRANKSGRSIAVVESNMRPHSLGGASIIFRLGATAMQHDTTDNTPNTGETRQNSNQTTSKASTGLGDWGDHGQGGSHANP